MNIGIDHGYYAIKTRHFSFPAGITAYSHEPYTLQNTLEYENTGASSPWGWETTLDVFGTGSPLSPHPPKIRRAAITILIRPAVRFFIGSPFYEANWFSAR